MTKSIIYEMWFPLSLLNYIIFSPQFLRILFSSINDKNANIPALLKNALRYIGEKARAAKITDWWGWRFRDDGGGTLEEHEGQHAPITLTHTFSRPAVARMFLRHVRFHIKVLQIALQIQEILFLLIYIIIAIAPNVGKLIND